MNAARNILKTQTFRRHERHEVTEPVMVCAPGVLDSRLPAITADVSYEGMSLVMPEAIPVGAAVLLEWDNRYLIGEVCHTRTDGSEFRSGIKLERLHANRRSMKCLLKKAAQSSATVA